MDLSSPIKVDGLQVRAGDLVALASARDEPTVWRRDKRLPFSNEQLRSIFNAPLYTGCTDDWHGFAQPGPEHPRRGRF